MNWLHETISKRTWFIIFNCVSLFGLWVKNLLHADLVSIIAVVLVFIVMNFVCWISSRKYPEWK